MGEPRSATVAAVGKVICLRIDLQPFEQLLGPVHEALTERASGYDKPPKGKTFMPAAPRLCDLQPTAALGSGGLAHVAMVRDSRSRQYYALKIVPKARVLKNAAVRCEAVVRERDALASLDHPFICRLHATYQDKRCLYFLLTLVQGGELFSLMDEPLNEPATAFYTASITHAFQHLHGQGFVYRDLKPENVREEKNAAPFAAPICPIRDATPVAPTRHTPQSSHVPVVTRPGRHTPQSSHTSFVTHPIRRTRPLISCRCSSIKRAT